MAPFLTFSIKQYGLRVKWDNTVKRVVSHLPLGVVAIEKGAFGSISTADANITLHVESKTLKLI